MDKNHIDKIAAPINPDRREGFHIPGALGGAAAILITIPP